MFNQATLQGRQCKSRANSVDKGLAALMILAFCLLSGGCFSHSRRGESPALSAAKLAEDYIGVPYRYGGRDPQKGFDCSGLTWYVYQRQGLKLPQTSRDQLKAGRKVNKAKLSPGDLVFFRNVKSRRVDHVGIYVGQGRFVHAPGAGKKVERRDLSEKYYKSAYYSARRVAD